MKGMINMSMTMTQKILAAHCHQPSVKAGELIECDLDLVLANDITAAPALVEFNKLGVDHVWDQNRIALVPDHFTPNKDIASAEQAKVMREFAHKMKIKNYFEIGQMGIEHVILPEKGIVAPGDLIIGADSHTCTYGALGAFSTGVGSTDAGMGMATGKVWLKVPAAISFVITGKFNKWVSGKDLMLYIIGLIGVDGALYQSMEFSGDGIACLTMDDRLTIANMAIEAGAKNAVFEVDDITRAYLQNRVSREYVEYHADADAEYERTIQIDLADVPMTVACPHLPSNTKAIDVLEKEKIIVDQVVIGSCTNGRISDMRIAASILQGQKVDPQVRCIVIPGSQLVYKECIEEGIATIFIEAGAIISTPTCGPCLGGYMGILAANEVALATTNRNFIGRMGHNDSKIYLASPAVAAATALKGYICQPDAIVKGE